MASDNKRIAKNTMFLYIRMFIIMGVTLYSSRVVLDKLGVVDYGLYNVVGGVVAMLSFLNGTLTAGTSRFITFELGSGEFNRLRDTFVTSYYTHLALGIIIIIIMESGGLWFMYNKLVIPSDRLQACFWVFQLSLITTFMNILQVPYTSLVSSHEHFNMYAYISIFEALAKLCICYTLTITSFDRLIVYASLLTIVQICMYTYYWGYCRKHFEESKLSIHFDKAIFKNLMTFSGWNIIANLTQTLRGQGITILINMFLAPVVVAAQAFANQVSTALMGFITNFRIAFNPQIIKMYASGEKDGSKKLTLQATIVCFDLTLLLALPCIFTMKSLMGVWLVETPDYAVLFTQCMLINNIIGTFSASFYVPMMAANKIKFNSVASVVLGIGEFVFLYCLLKAGCGPHLIPIMHIVCACGYAFFVKPYVLWKDINYSLQDLMSCYWPCLKVLLFALLGSLPFKFLLTDSLLHTIILFFITAAAVIISSWLFLDKTMKVKLIEMAKYKIFKK